MALTLSTEDFQAIFRGIHNGKAWFIAPAGDSPSGAGAYPGDEDAWADVAASVASGDTIILKPSANAYGEFDLGALSNVTLLGQGALTVAAGTDGHVITLGNGCAVKNLKVTNTDAAAAAGIYCTGKTDVLIEDVWAVAADTGIDLHGNSSGRIRRCRVQGAQYGIAFGVDGAAGTPWNLRSFIEDCNIETRGWSSCSSSCVTLASGVSAVIRNSIIDARATTEQPEGDTACALNVVNGLALVENCALIAMNSTADGGSNRNGVGVVAANGALVHLSGVNIKTSGGAGDFIPYDLYVTDAATRLYIGGSVQYDESKVYLTDGVITRLGLRDSRPGIGSPGSM